MRVEDLARLNVGVKVDVNVKALDRAKTDFPGDTTRPDEATQLTAEGYQHTGVDTWAKGNVIAFTGKSGDEIVASEEGGAYDSARASAYWKWHDSPLVRGTEAVKGGLAAFFGKIGGGIADQFQAVKGFFRYGPF